MIRATALGLLCLLAPGPADATVLEYTRDGRVIVRGSSTSKVELQARTARPTRVLESRAVYRTMAEQVALRHAGDAGPRHAGLDAASFIRVFVELIRAESAFNPRALSPKGAQGLGQLMPETARVLGVRDPWDPEQNLDGAARYFAAQLARFGNVHQALAAYNAGPHRVIQYGGIPPYRETRAYVAKITAAVGLAPRADSAPLAVVEVRPVLSTKNPPEKDLSVWQY